MDEGLGPLLRAVLDEPIAIRVRHDLEPAQQRLLAALGAAYVVDADAPPCDRACGRKECAVSAESPQIIGRHTPGARALRLGEATPISTRRPFDPEPERREPKTAEQLRAEEQERADGRPITTLCGLCDWRFEGTVGEGREAARLHREHAHPEAASAKGSRRNSSGWRRTANDNQERKAAMATVEQRRQAHDAAAGRELLERMDAGEPLNDEPEVGLEEASEPNGAGSGASSSPSSGLEEAAAVGHGAVSGAGQSLSEPERVAASSSPRRRGSNDRWTREKIVEAIRAEAERTGFVPQQRAWNGPSTDAHPNWLHVQRVFGNWGNAIEAAGYPRPRRGGKPVAIADLLGSEREPQAVTTPLSGDSGLDVGQAASSRSEHDGTGTDPREGRIRVPGTGLTYRSVDGALSAADEIEADGERVARQARDDGNEGKADQAIDASRELARKIRAAAADELASSSGTSNEVGKQEEPIQRRGGRKPTWTREAALERLARQAVDGVAPARADFLRSGISNSVIVRLFGTYTDMVAEAGLAAKLQSRYDAAQSPRLLVNPDEMAPFQRGLARALIAGMRAAADALEQELAG